MSGEQMKPLSPYWQKLVNAADTILQQRIDSLRARTVQPEWCLAADDKMRMAKQQMEVDGMKDVQKAVRRGGFLGKTATLDTVLSEKPCLVFSKN